MRPGLKLQQGHPAGRDPRKMTRDDLREVGHKPMSPLQALRAHCLDCCGHQEKEVARCPAVDCSAWPFRMGTNPWRKPPSEARREAARQAMTNLNARRRKRDAVEPSASPPNSGTAPVLPEGSEVVPTSGLLPASMGSPRRNCSVRNGTDATRAVMSWAASRPPRKPKRGLPHASANPSVTPLTKEV
jgi:hypothetical protein